MFDLTTHPLLLRSLALAHRLRRSLAGRRRAMRAADAQRTAFYEQAWREAAETLEATVTDLGEGIQEIARGAARTRVRRNYTALDDPLTLAVAGSKPLVSRLLACQGLPVPQGTCFTLDNVATALDFLRQAGRPCVVKPAHDTGAGHGVTTGVTTKTRLIRATAAAAALSRTLLIEEQIEGEVYRLLYLDGTLLDAVVRRRPAVTGDGHRTVRQLLDRCNAERMNRGIAVSQTPLSDDLDLRHTLARQGLGFSSVPASGRLVTLKAVCNQNSAAENHPARSLLCGSIIQDGAQAAAAVGARLAGVDVMTSDPGVPLAESGGAVIEVNTTPGYYYHYYQSGQPVQVAVPILRRLLFEAHANLREESLFNCHPCTADTL